MTSDQRERPTEALRKKILGNDSFNLYRECDAIDATIAAKDRRIAELERRICEVHIQTSLAYGCDRTPNNEEICRILEAVEAAMDGIDILKVTQSKEPPHA